MKIKKNHVMIIIYLVLMAALTAITVAFSLSRKQDTTVKIGFITSGNVDDSGWTSTNYRCAKQACENVGAELLTAANVDDSGESCQRAVDNMVKSGAGMIILNSSELAEHVKPLLSRYPDVSFYGANADYETMNMTAYSCRMYQVRYLSGIVAGMYTKTGKIGFVAAQKESSAYRGINAFALGVRSVNPDAEVIVAWTNSWEDEEREEALALALIENENVDLLTYHQHMPYVINAAEQCGIASIGYYEPVDGVSDRYLTCAMCDWTVMYEKMLHSYISGHGNAVTSEWTGIESGAITLADFSPLVSAETAEKVEAAKQRLISGWHVFSGEIYDNEGNERCAQGESMSDDHLLHRMDWLTEGVREYAE